MDTASIAVWDVPLPVVGGERFAIKVGVTAGGAALTGHDVEVRDQDGKVVASGQLGATPWPDTDGLHWVELKVPAPAANGLAEFTVRSAGTVTRFSVAAVAKPEHTLTVSITERITKEPLGDVEIRLGAFHARTDAKGRAALRVGKGAYQLVLWRNGYDAPVTPIEISGDANVDITMLHVPEDHPDARWVR